MAYIFTFIEGVFAFVSPCILPMLPIFLAYISADEEKSVQKRFVNTLFFVLGFTFSFVVMGRTAFSLGRFLQSYKRLLIKLAGVAMVFFGCVYLDIFNINLGREAKNIGGKGLISNFLFGISYSFGWTPCMGVFLGSALTLAGVQDTVFKGMLLLFCFGMGLGLPFILFSLMYAKLRGVVDFLKKNSQKIKLIGGGMLIAVGLAMVFDLFGYYLGLFGSI